MPKAVVDLHPFLASLNQAFYGSEAFGISEKWHHRRPPLMTQWAIALRQCGLPFLNLRQAHWLFLSLPSWPKCARILMPGNIARRIKSLPSDTLQQSTAFEIAIR